MDLPQTRMSAGDYRTHLRTDLDRIDTCLQAAGDLDVTVPGCPDWDLADLIGHLGGVHRMVVTAVETGEPSRSTHHPMPDDADPRTWLREGAERLLAVLDGAPDTPAWSFDPEDHSLGFWHRRQAMEHVIHRLDVEEAVGDRTPLPRDLAADGVSEVFETMVRLRVAVGVLTLPEYAIELSSADTGHVWRFGDGELAGSVAGNAEMLLLTLWRRRTDPLLITGDTEAVGSFLALRLTP